MLYETPAIGRPLRKQLDQLHELRARLGGEANRPTRWMGNLRRQARASTVASSTAIEGYVVSEADAAALVAGREAPDPTDEHGMAVASYAHAMDHVAVMAADPTFRWLDRVILDLHFDACHFQRDKRPGRWRTGFVAVTDPEDGARIAYRGPDAQEVPALAAEVVDWLDRGDAGADAVVRAAMAHLHVVSVHPFEDGNGRLARIVQSLVLARDGLVAPEFASIEEYLGRHTSAYCTVLRDVQGGSYRPTRDATPWVRFCVEAHLQQARRRLEQIETAAARWEQLEELVVARGWPDRLVIALEQSLIGGSDRAAYAREAGVSAASASNDFRRLVDADLVEQRGQGRNTRYVASDELRRRAAPTG